MCVCACSCFFLFLLLVRVGSACWWRSVLLLWCQCSLKLYYTLVVMLHGPKRMLWISLHLLIKELAKQTFIFTFFYLKKTKKKTIGLTYMFDRGYVLWSLVPTLMQVHFHCTTHGYIVLKEESCSYSSEFCYASFQVIPQY